MSKPLPLLAAFLAGVIFALLGAVVLRPVQAASVKPTHTITSTFTPMPATATLTPQPSSTPIQITSTIPPTPPTVEPTAPVIGWGGEVKCYDCTPLKVKVKLTHYNPAIYDPEYPELNCWQYSEEHQWCTSTTWIGVPWESGWGLFSACSSTWAVGSWVEIPGVITTICMDHGGSVICKGDICNVDVLGPGGAEWDGKTYEATLWVPKSFLIRYAESQEE